MTTTPSLKITNSSITWPHFPTDFRFSKQRYPHGRPHEPCLRQVSRCDQPWNLSHLVQKYCRTAILLAVTSEPPPHPPIGKQHLFPVRRTLTWSEVTWSPSDIIFSGHNDIHLNKDRDNCVSVVRLKAHYCTPTIIPLHKSLTYACGAFLKKQA